MNDTVAKLECRLANYLCLLISSGQGLVEGKINIRRAVGLQDVYRTNRQTKVFYPPVIRAPVGYSLAAFKYSQHCNMRKHVFMAFKSIFTT